MPHRSLAFLVVAACGSPAPSQPQPATDPQGARMMSSMAMPADDGSSYAPLAVGADHASYVNRNLGDVPGDHKITALP